MSDNELIQRVLYHQVQPQSIQATYTEYNQLDFLISVGEGRSLLPGSVRILADLRVNETGLSRSSGQITYNKNCGGHAFIDSVQVQTQNQGLLENLQNYGRYVNMDANASLDNLDMLDSKQACELRAPTQAVATDMCEGIVSSAGGGNNITNDADFSIKPLVCLNKMNRDLPFSKSGIVTVQLTLARSMSALFGQSQTVDANYSLSNVRCCYKSIVEPMDKSPVNMGVIYSVKSNILSGTASISANVPAVCESVAINFIQNQHENVQVYDNYKNESVQGLEELQFIMNDQTNSLVTYQLTDQTEILERFIDSMRNTSHNQVSLQKFRSNCAFACGLNFEAPIDLSNNRFTLQITSGITNQYPVNVFMYFMASASI
tara:strand:- start:3054 stop:4178 length:1125 start_codon:yes stop_codon:yes gene_type:complete